MYLTHIFLFPFMVHTLNHWAPEFFSGQILGRGRGVVIILACILTITLPVSALTYQLIEQPGIRLGRLLIDRIEGRDKRLSI